MAEQKTPEQIGREAAEEVAGAGITWSAAYIANLIRADRAAERDKWKNLTDELRARAEKAERQNKFLTSTWLHLDGHKAMLDIYERELEKRGNDAHLQDAVTDIETLLARVALAEKECDELTAKLAGTEQENDGRRRALEDKARGLKSEWVRAERAETALALLGGPSQSCAHVEQRPGCVSCFNRCLAQAEQESASLKAENQRLREAATQYHLENGACSWGYDKGAPCPLCAALAPTTPPPSGTRPEPTGETDLLLSAGGVATPGESPGGGVVLSEAIVERARDEIARLCAGPGRMGGSLAGRNWTMRVPAEETDSDLVFWRLCDHAEALRAQLGEAREVIEELREALAGYGCDCGTDEPGSCGLCIAQAYADKRIAALDQLDGEGRGT